MDYCFPRSVIFPLFFHINTVYLHVFSAPGIKEDSVSGMGIYRMRMGILPQPVAFMFALGNPPEEYPIPVRDHFTDVFTIFFVRIGTIVGTFFPDDLHVFPEFEIPVADQVHVVIHGEMPIRLILFRQCYLPVLLGSHIISPNHSRTIVIPTMIDNDIPVITPHLMTYPVGRLTRVPACVARGIRAFFPDADDV